MEVMRPNINTNLANLSKQNALSWQSPCGVYILLQLPLSDTDEQFKLIKVFTVPLYIAHPPKTKYFTRPSTYHPCQT
jgi:hypothetical protein